MPSIVNLEDIPTKQDIIKNMQVHSSAKTKNELAEAYKFALENNITGIEDIKKVEFTGVLTRIQMAKMISNYAINVM
jgi:flagellar assembly factor FliW